MEATKFLTDAAKVMKERGKNYDKTNKERSMAATVKAFNAITGNEMTESEGWLLMNILKQVRQFSQQEYHEDSALDGVAYSALLAESLSNE